MKDHVLFEACPVVVGGRVSLQAQLLEIGDGDLGRRGVTANGLAFFDECDQELLGFDVVAGGFLCVVGGVVTLVGDDVAGAELFVFESGGDES